jgi:hypothetical protein
MNGSLGPALYTVGVVASVCVASAALSRWTSTDVLDRALVALVCASSILAGVPLVLAMAGLLSAVPYLAAMIALGIAGLVVLVRTPPTPSRAPSAWSLAGIVSVAIGAGLATLALIPTVEGLPTGHHDSRNYHIGNLFAWYQDHSLWSLPFQNPGFFTATHPGNAELATIGTMFATGGDDHLLYVANILFGALAVIACTSIARDLGGRPHQGALAAMAVLASPIAFGTQAHGLGTDLPAAAGLLAGVATLLRARTETHHRVRWIVLSGFALGFGLGTKYTVLLLVPVVVAGAVLALRPRRDVAWLVPGLVVLAAPWFVRNWITTGNPLFPQGISLFGIRIFPGGEGPLLELKTPIAEHALSGNWSIVARWADLGWDFIGPAALLAIAGVVGAFLQRPRHRHRLAFAGLAVATWLVYVITPYTGGGPTGMVFLVGSNLRYTLPALLVGVALASVAVPSRILIALTSATFAFAAWKLARGYGFRHDLDLTAGRLAIIATVVVVVCVGMLTIGRRNLAPNAFAYACSVAVACAVMNLTVFHIDSSVAESRLERVIAASGSAGVVVVGSDDIASIIDGNPAAELVRVTGGGRAGERPPASVRQLAREIDAADADVLVVRDGTPGVPKGWEPEVSDWKHTASTTGGEVYVRQPEPPVPPMPTPSKPTAPAPSPPPKPGPIQP